MATWPLNAESPPAAPCSGVVVGMGGRCEDPAPGAIEGVAMPWESTGGLEADPGPGPLGPGDTLGDTLQEGLPGVVDSPPDNWAVGVSGTAGGAAAPLPAVRGLGDAAWARATPVAPAPGNGGTPAAEDRATWAALTEKPAPGCTGADAGPWGNMVGDTVTGGEGADPAPGDSCGLGTSVEEGPTALAGAAWALALAVADNTGERD
jgi:hypothetical protein